MSLHFTSTSLVERLKSNLSPISSTVIDLELMHPFVKSSLFSVYSPDCVTLRSRVVPTT